MALNWRNNILGCGLFIFKVESQKNDKGKREWIFNEVNNAWTDGKTYKFKPDAKMACEAWVKLEVKKMQQHIDRDWE